MKPELRKRILNFNKERAKDKEMAEDLQKLLTALPPGQVKQLLKNEECVAILRKYGFSTE